MIVLFHIFLLKIDCGAANFPFFPFRKRKNLNVLSITLLTFEFIRVHDLLPILKTIVYYVLIELDRDQRWKVLSLPTQLEINNRIWMFI
jgi:hypothetical protein